MTPLHWQGSSPLAVMTEWRGVGGEKTLLSAGRACEARQRCLHRARQLTKHMGIQPRVKSLRSSYTGLHPQTETNLAGFVCGRTLPEGTISLSLVSADLSPQLLSAGNHPRRNCICYQKLMPTSLQLQHLAMTLLAALSLTHTISRLHPLSLSPSFWAAGPVPRQRTLVSFA